MARSISYDCCFSKVQFIVLPGHNFGVEGFYVINSTHSVSLAPLQDGLKLTSHFFRRSASKMLSRHTVEEFRKLLRFFHFIGWSPYQWDKKNQKFRITRSRFRMALWVFNSLYWAVNTVHSVVSFIYRYYTNTFRDATDMAMHMVWVLGFPSLLLSSINTAYRLSELKECLNQVFALDQAFSGKRDKYALRSF